MALIKKILGLELLVRDRNQLNRKLHAWYYPIVSFLLWLLFVPLSVCNSLGLFNAVHFLVRLIYPTRKLNKEEVRKLERVYGVSPWYYKVRVLECSRLAIFGTKFIRSPHLGFVFCNTIHFSRNIYTALDNDQDMAWLVHEYIHIIQYNQFGIVYIPMALRAQKNGGYSYDELWLKSPLKSFNLEQQGDVARAYFQALDNGKDISVYQTIVPCLKSGKV
ncbi:hypothetical protein DNU06_12915 [Putridiphycobacter roseus]|uniref:DUF4157 domain-containing protein n=1 Tax=Putridiphycobacter roseus TaxID=2219161 RepID=A0A2W1NBI5_9FLAO|nr:hypothetical protein [Putridiphycobacter roseus]PZE16443.1 hypothetical protein DNU06_12915 [Putridiphycobacter roseus]